MAGGGGGIGASYQSEKTDASSAKAGDFYGGDFIVNKDTLDATKLIIIAAAVIAVFLLKSKGRRRK